MDMISREDADVVYFVVSDKNGNKVQEDTAVLAVQQFLTQFKSHSFRIKEYRNNRHMMLLDLANGNIEGYMNRSFLNRNEAKQFVAEGEI